MAVTLTPSAKRWPEMKPYRELEERMLARDQVGASQVFYDLVRAGRPVAEMVRETVRIHAPYTHVPFHQRLDNGLVRFVNNDHTLLGMRASLRLTRMVPTELRYLPLAQIIWYIPTGLDPWNQLVGKAPGHYAEMKRFQVVGNLPPEIHWQDQEEPLYEEGTYDDRLNGWLTRVQVGDVVNAYRIFLGLWEDEVNRPKLLTQLMFAGLIDVQDRQTFRTSYTTGHKAFRARATIELAQAVGFEHARPIVFAGAPDLAIGPHWYSNYEMACNVAQLFFQGKDAELLHNTRPPTRAEAKATVQALIRGNEPTAIRQVTALLQAGRGPRQVLDVVQLAAAELVLESGAPPAFSQPMHAAEYCHTLRWFWDNFDHPHKVKLLFVAASYVNDTALHQTQFPGNGPIKIRAGRGMEALSGQQLLRRLDEAILALNPDETLALTAAYLKNGYDRAPLVQTIATTGCSKFGNDPHNQEIGLSLIEDYAHSTAVDRDRLLLAAAKFAAGYRKYGEPLEAYRRFTEAFGIGSREASRGDAPAEEALFDDD